MKIPHDPSEIIAVVDEKDNIVKGATRKEVHKKGLLHREACVYLINSSKEVLLQKRSDRHIWDSSAAGHFPKNQNYKEAIKRETEEELGLKVEKNEFQEVGYEKLKVDLEDNIKNYKFSKIFILRKDVPIEKFNIDKGEIEKIKYFDLEEVETLLKNPYKLTPSNKTFIEKYILKEIN